jgi:hypothetical protein
MARKGIKPEEIIENVNKAGQHDNVEECDFSTDSEKDEMEANGDNVEAESDSELEFIAKSFNDDQGLNELMKGGVQRLRHKFFGNERKLDNSNSKPKIRPSMTFLTKKRKHEN